MPDDFAARRVDREHAAAGVRFLAVNIRQRNVSDSLMAGNSPQNSAQRAALADPSLPYDFPVLIGIERVHHSRLLARHQHLLAAADIK